MSEVPARADRRSSYAEPATPWPASSRGRRTAVMAAVLLLTAGLVPAYAASAASSSATRLAGFSTAGASVRVGGVIWAPVTVLPRASRVIVLQYRRAGTGSYRTASAARTTARGAVTLGLRPPAAGTWQFRAVLPATRQATAFTSPPRTVVASGRAAATVVEGFATAATAVSLGGTVADDVVVVPGSGRDVSVQARRPGTTAFTTVSAGRSSSTGAFHAVFRPTTLGEWGFRLVVMTGPTALAAVTPTRLVSAVDPTVPGQGTVAPVPVVVAPGPATTPPGTGTPPGPVPPPPGPTVGAPGPVTALAATAITRTSIALRWANPSAADLAGAVVRRAVGATAPATVTDGTPVADVPVPGHAVTDTGLDAGTTYTYAVFAHDSGPHYSAAAELTVSTRTPATSAVLTVKVQGRPNSRPTDRLTLDTPFAFDASDSLARDGETLVSGTIDYGDGETFAFTDPSGPLDYWNTVHSYATTGWKTVTLTVTDSAGATDTATTAVRVVDVPTASISVTSGAAQAGSPVTLALDAVTPDGTQLDHYFLMVTGPDHFFVGGDVAPPATHDITFDQPGSYTVTFCADNDAGGESVATVDVDVAP